VVGEAVVCIVLANALLQKLGGDSLDELLERFRQLRTARLEDLEMDDEPIVFWD
jgi:chorismate synthase